MSTKRTRRTAEQLLADYQDKVTKLKKKVDDKKNSNLTKLGETVQKIFGEEISADNFDSVLSSSIGKAGKIRRECHNSQIIQDKFSDLLTQNKISQEIYDKTNAVLDNIKHILFWIKILKKLEISEYDDSKAGQIIDEILKYVNSLE